MEAFGPIGGLRRLVEQTAEDFEPGLLSAATAMVAVDHWAAIERVACAAKLRAAARAEDVGLDAEGLVASASGTTSHAARRQTQLRHKLRNKGKTAEAFSKGKLSETQAKAISDAVDENPDAEDDLLALAAKASAADLIKECERVRRDALDKDGSLAGRQRAARRLRTWTDAMGMTCFSGALEPIIGAKFAAELLRRADTLFRAQSRDRSATVDTAEQRNADALAQIIESLGNGDGPKGSRRGPRTLVRILIDEAALKRGWVEAGERCETGDGVQLPVSAVVDALEDRDTKVQRVLTRDGEPVAVDGVDVTKISSHSRYIPQRLRDALEARGICCIVPGCGRTKGLELDHNHPISELGLTEFANLGWKCRYHHLLKTLGLMTSWRDEQGKWHYEPVERARARSS